MPSVMILRSKMLSKITGVGRLTIFYSSKIARDARHPGILHAGKGGERSDIGGMKFPRRAGRKTISD
jgi:hypothetical protein